MQIVERKSEYTDDNGKKHKYIEVVQVNEDGSEEIRATIDTELSDKQPQEENTEPINNVYDEIKSIKQPQEENTEPINNVYDEIKSIINKGEYTKDDLLNKIDTLFVMNRLTTEQYKELSGMIN